MEKHRDLAKDEAAAQVSVVLSLTLPRDPFNRTCLDITSGTAASEIYKTPSDYNLAEPRTVSNAMARKVEMFQKIHFNVILRSSNIGVLSPERYSAEAGRQFIAFIAYFEGYKYSVE